MERGLSQTAARDRATRCELRQLALRLKMLFRDPKFFDRKAGFAGMLAAFAVIAGIYFGSRGLKHFDPAVIWYDVGSVLAAFAVAYRFTVWSQRPPSRMYFKRGAQILFRK